MVLRTEVEIGSSVIFCEICNFVDCLWKEMGELPVSMFSGEIRCSDLFTLIGPGEGIISSGEISAGSLTI